MGGLKDCLDGYETAQVFTENRKEHKDSVSYPAGDLSYQRRTHKKQ